MSQAERQPSFCGMRSIATCLLDGLHDGLIGMGPDGCGQWLWNWVQVLEPDQSFCSTKISHTFRGFFISNILFENYGLFRWKYEGTNAFFVHKWIRWWLTIYDTKNEGWWFIVSFFWCECLLYFLRFLMKFCCFLFEGPYHAKCIKFSKYSFFADSKHGRHPFIDNLILLPFLSPKNIVMNTNFIKNLKMI